MMNKASRLQPDKDSEEDKAEEEKGNSVLLFQKKAMRLLRNDVENIMASHAQKGEIFQAF